MILSDFFLKHVRNTHNKKIRGRIILRLKPIEGLRAGKQKLHITVFGFIVIFDKRILNLKLKTLL